MTLAIGADAPDFALGDGGPGFHEWRSGRRTLVIAFKALSPTSTTESQVLWRLLEAFEARETAMLGLCGDTAEDTGRWIGDLETLFGHGLPCRLVADPDLAIAGVFGIAAPDQPGGLQRALLLVGPGGRLEFASAGPVTAGRNFHEILRLIDSIRLTASDRVATPADWRPGDPVLLPPSLPQAEAERRHGAGLRTIRPYLRYIPGARVSGAA